MRSTVFEASLGVMAGLVDTLTVDRDRMRAAADEGYTTATAVADALVRRGIPFRTAHHVVGSLVAAGRGDGHRRWTDVPDATIGVALGAAGDAGATALGGRPGHRRRRCGRPPRSTARWRPATSSAARRPLRVADALRAARGPAGPRRHDR